MSQLEALSGSGLEHDKNTGYPRLAVGNDFGSKEKGDEELAAYEQRVVLGVLVDAKLLMCMNVQPQGWQAIGAKFRAMADSLCACMCAWSFLCGSLLKCSLLFKEARRLLTPSTPHVPSTWESPDDGMCLCVHDIEFWSSIWASPPFRKGCLEPDGKNCFR
ncbi:hypothetical protein ZHAS_00010960 [Anopheles sinensis]|uniref:Uncharacterized protein n=1 Tax=Anopheles sinensis TaxID=74873 RepID=A0A084VYZ1_ANOSI|nr:hypothetical protein ZHAS_00010960 [Anopheles sinensis]